MFDPSDDPLGIGIQDRAQKRRQSFALNEGWGHPTFGPLPDPRWEGFSQALGEAGVDELVGGNVPHSNAFVGLKHLPNMNNANEIPGGTFSPATGQPNRAPFQAQQNQGIFGAAEQRGRQSMLGLQNAFRTPNRAMPQSHEDWMQQNDPRRVR